MKFAMPFILFVAVFAILAVGLEYDPRLIPSPLVNRPAPEFQLAQLAEPNKAFSPKDVLGKVWLLNAWASWCQSCREEHSLLLALSRAQDIPIYGLNYKDRRASALAWLQALGDPYVMSAQDADGRVGIDYGVYGVPETYLIDKTGVIRFKQIGPITMKSMEETILPMIRELTR